MALALALLLDARLRDPWGRTPAQIPHATPIYKGDGRDPRDWLSFRLIMLLSTLTKIDETVLMRPRPKSSSQVAGKSMKSDSPLPKLESAHFERRPRSPPVSMQSVPFLYGFGRPAKQVRVNFFIPFS